MQSLKEPCVLVEHTFIESHWLKRDVKIDIYLPYSGKASPPSHLLLINDGQDMEKMGFASILEGLYANNKITPLVCVCIHCGPERKMEYGVAGHPDYKGRGAKAGMYTQFIIEELFPFINERIPVASFSERAFAGFSLGGLSALDITWAHPGLFNKVGVFSGSLWWRSIDQMDEEYDDQKHRIMHQKIRNGVYQPELQFFFQCGNLDEVRDRNKNGIIDSIDDTIDLIKELEAKGYQPKKDIHYLEMEDGRHDVDTWGRAMKEFLNWGWGR